ncbi:MAG: potassium transporter Trk [Chloroflexi bacterium]|nr:potassium transporter Trk [Chloroflexota bacterium]
MKLKPQVVVVGLGRFGKSFASKMYNLGHDVMAIDIDPDKVQSMVGQVTYPVTTDASSEISLRELGVQDFDVGVVALADVEVSIMVSVLFKTLNINNIIARASSDLHKDTLIRLGCDRVVFAEDEMGEQLANTIFSPNVTEYLELSPNMGISKLSIPKRIVGMSLSEAGFINQPGNQKLAIISIKRGDNIILYPSNQEILNEGDEISIIGNNSNINKLLI